MSKRTHNDVDMRTIIRVVNTFGFDGAQEFLSLIEADYTPRQVVARMMPFIKRAAQRRREARSNA